MNGEKWWWAWRQGPAGQARHTSCPEASTVHPLGFLHLALPSHGPAVHKPFSRQMFWISFPVLIEGSFSFCWVGRGEIRPIALSPFPLLSFLSGGEAVHFQAKGGVRWFAQPFPSRNQASQGSQPLFPVGGRWSSPQFPPPLFPTGTHLSKIVANPVHLAKYFPAVSGRKKTSLPQIRCLSLERTIAS